MHTYIDSVIFMYYTSLLIPHPMAGGMNTCMNAAGF